MRANCWLFIWVLPNRCLARIVVEGPPYDWASSEFACYPPVFPPQIPYRSLGISTHPTSIFGEPCGCHDIPNIRSVPSLGYYRMPRDGVLGSINYSRRSRATPAMLLSLRMDACSASGTLCLIRHARISGPDWYPAEVRRVLKSEKTPAIFAGPNNPPLSE
ncbi:unnamed protein product [Protopolystoma xenopodis]|uniref:Secreted protein n=1 Tax=Protopolystoma xenopodis TaxID=117903 RepID=A0A448WEP4_9PLAT|nr:unnamed protein product [Protopolystoma xenopodis]